VIDRLLKSNRGLLPFHFLKAVAARLILEAGAAATDGETAVIDEMVRDALDASDERTSMGLVRYGGAGITRWNTWPFVTTKRLRSATEREVRALIWRPELVGYNRHIGPENRFHDRPLTPPPDSVPYRPIHA
jgi:hypothetical protein